jgi:Fe-S oxidoreductase
MKKLKLDPGRNDHIRVTFHDSCNPAGAMGILENRVCNRASVTIFLKCRKKPFVKTFCCGGGAGLGTTRTWRWVCVVACPEAIAVK